MSHPIKSPRKLIEVALPLDAINEASTRENYIYRGNPSSLHKWWAQRPLAAARAVVFCQMVNDPSWKWEFNGQKGVPRAHLKATWAASRKRLFDLLTELVQWESNANENILGRARAEIWKSWRETCELITEEIARGRADLAQLIGKTVTVIAWLWARTVRSPNPAFSHIPVPLAASFILSSKVGREVYLEPVVRSDGYAFEVREGRCPENLRRGTKAGRGKFRCLMSD